MKGGCHQVCPCGSCQDIPAARGSSRGCQGCNVGTGPSPQLRVWGASLGAGLGQDVLTQWLAADFTPLSMPVSSIPSIVWSLLLHPVCESCARVTRMCGSPKLVAGGSVGQGRNPTMVLWFASSPGSGVPVGLPCFWDKGIVWTSVCPMGRGCPSRSQVPRAP